MKRELKDREFKVWRAGLKLLLLSAALLALGLCVGSQGFEPLWWGWPGDRALEEAAQASGILWQIRGPRSAGAWLAGALLGLAGAVAQGLFRNPLADPYLLGSASGAGLGVSLAVLASSGGVGLAGTWGLGAGLGPWGTTAAAFVGAWGAVLLTGILARGVQQGLSLLLAGLIVGVFLGAINACLSWLHPEILQNMQAFALGSAAWLDGRACGLMLLALLVCGGVAWSLSRVLDALVLGEDTALSLGLPVHAARRLLVAVLALATASAVAQTGLIAFVGLAAPHMVRRLWPCTHAGLLLLSLLCGGLLLLAADLLARWAWAPQELPVGIVTAALGGAYLLGLLYRRPASRPQA